MRTFKDSVTNEIWQFEDYVTDIFMYPGTPTTLQPYTIPDPTHGETILAARAVRIAEIDAECKAAITAGIISNALGDDYTYPTSEIDQQNLTANVVSSLLPDLAIDWITFQACQDEAGEWAYRAHTAAQIQQVGADVKAAILAFLIRKETAATLITASITLEDITAVTF